MRKMVYIIVSLLVMTFLFSNENVKAKQAVVGKAVISKIAINKNNRPVISWNKVDGATGYRIYKVIRYPSNVNRYVKIKTTSKLTATDNSFYDTPGCYVEYVVRAYYKDNMGKVTWGKRSKAKRVFIPSRGGAYTITPTWGGLNVTVNQGFFNEPTWVDVKTYKDNHKVSLTNEDGYVVSYWISDSTRDDINRYKKAYKSFGYDSCLIIDGVNPPRIEELLYEDDDYCQFSLVSSVTYDSKIGKKYDEKRAIDILKACSGVAFSGHYYNEKEKRWVSMKFLYENYRQW